MAAAAKKGRPRSAEHDAIKLLGSLFPELGRRALEDRYYALGALRELGVLPDEGFTAVPDKARWFCPGDDGHRWKYALLAALGRIKHANTICIFAKRLAELRPDVKRGIAFVKEWRERRDFDLIRSRYEDFTGEALEKLAQDAAVRACGLN